MNTNRKTAIITGIIFIIATAAGLLGNALTGSIVGAPDYLVQIAANKNLVVVGALLAFVAAAGSAGIAISLYPVLRKHNEGLALGSVGFRLVEGVFYLVGVLGLFSLLSLGQEYASAGPQAAPAIQVLGDLILAVRVWAGFVLGVIAFCLGAGYVLLRAVSIETHPSLAIRLGSGRARVGVLDDSVDCIRRKNFRTFRYAGVVGSPDRLAGNGSGGMADS